MDNNENIPCDKKAYLLITMTGSYGTDSNEVAFNSQSPLTWTLCHMYIIAMQELNGRFFEKKILFQSCRKKYVFMLKSYK